MGSKKKLILSSIKSLFGELEYRSTWNLGRGKDLIVLNYHGTPKSFLPNFRRQLEFFRSSFDIVSPDFLKLYFGGEELPSTGRDKILLTFDDGIRNNLLAAAELEKIGVRGLFFIVPEFVEQEPQNQKKYFMEHIRKELPADEFSEEQDWSSLSWKEVKELADRGHWVGSHSMTHQMRADQTSIENYKNEVLGSRNKILDQVGKIDNVASSFCSPVDSLLSTNRDQMKLIQQNYSYFFSSYPGDNFNEKNPYFIKRSNVEADWGLSKVIYQVGRWDRFRWRNKINKFDQIIRSF